MTWIWIICLSIACIANTITIALEARERRAWQWRHYREHKERAGRV